MVENSPKWKGRGLDEKDSSPQHQTVIDFPKLLVVAESCELSDTSKMLNSAIVFM